MATKFNTTVPDRATPVPDRHGYETQEFGSVVHMPIALSATARLQSATNLNQLLADTLALRDLYKKHHWQASGPAFYPLHLLFDKHFAEQSGLADEVAERVQALGGVAVAAAHDVAEMTLVPRPPRGREGVPAQFARLLHAHEVVLKEARAFARQAAEAGDDGTNDLLAGRVIRANEAQVWFVAEHAVPAPDA
jgi:starvation-inducible DNA-binding protein